MGQMQLETLIQRWQRARIAVVGDVMLDVSMEGRMGSASPEDYTMPVVRVTKRTTRLGGAALAAKIMADLGAAPICYGVVGKDLEGRTVRGLLQRDRVGAGIWEDESRPTTSKTRYRTQFGSLARFDREHRDAISPELAASLGSAIATTDQLAGALVSDYGKGVLRGPGMALADVISSRGIPMVLDPKDVLLGTPSAVTPNRVEFIGLGGSQHPGPAARRIREKLGRNCVVAVTRGENGCSLHQHEDPEKRSLIRTVEVQARTVCGAGDAFAAAFTLTLAAGGTWEQAAIMGNAAASLLVQELPLDCRALKSAAIAVDWLNA